MARLLFRMQHHHQPFDRSPMGLRSLALPDSDVHAQIAAACAGDVIALDRLLARSRQNLRRYAEYHCAVNDIEDAVQESLITVSRRIGSLRTVETFISWVFRIVKRECNRYKRVTRRLRGEAVTEEILPAAASEPVDLRHDVCAALDSLPAHYREILLYRDVEGLTIDEIAERTGLHRDAVKSRLHRARVLAREYLGGPPTSSKSG
jgi:RNA polymerase sigma factor (sigma-70 family)